MTQQAATGQKTNGLASRTAQTLALDKPVSAVRYASGKRLEALKELGIHTVGDLLFHYPFRYDDFSDVVSIREAPLGENVSIFGRIDEVKIKKPRPKLSLVEVSVLDGTSVLYATWFNQPWLNKSLAAGTPVFLRGKVEHSYGYKRMTNPLLTVLGEDDGLDAESLSSPEVKAQAGSILPVYHANAGITSSWVARLVKTVLGQAPAPFDPLPPQLRRDLGLASFQGALRDIHQPSSQDARGEARRRLAFDEVFYLMLYFKRLRAQQNISATPRTHTTGSTAFARLKTLLPFTLSPDQEAAIKEIAGDMAQSNVMNRLLLGDVGSGKTIVAAFALAIVFDSGFQAAMMAPTEVLVQQYALKLGPLFDELGIPWAQLTSSVTPQARRDLLAQLKSGELTVVFGTHALLEPDVIFKNLSLTVIDEQHRFGVDQRAALRAKGAGCDALMMTATPIPRSLALVLYGDLSPTYLRTSHRTSKTSTAVVHHSLIGHAYDAVREALREGHQAYVVCPLIASSEVSSFKNVDEQISIEKDAGSIEQEYNSLEDIPLIDLFTDAEALDDKAAIAAAEQEVSFLQNKVFPDHTVALLTGRMTSDEKQNTMSAFRNGDIDVLVSTTVIEVGVDVPNATVMIVQDADRFGITQLHQLRGRIGRGAWDGEFYLVTRTKNEEARKRLQLLETISDGFELANADLRLRREGDVLGSRQHGSAALKLIKVLDDAELITQANEAASTLLKNDPELSAPEHAFLAHELLRRIPKSDGEPCG
ncbi:MAG: ATP-dependent DNA helicase RecG [Coriobacteriia bacterium]|nr:ATP-dependent DNA helicase RecG [Coriobacteriia bacterium]